MHIKVDNLSKTDDPSLSQNSQVSRLVFSTGILLFEAVTIRNMYGVAISCSS